MKCPQCGSGSRVRATREAPNHSIVRERECSNERCRARWRTVEAWAHVLSASKQYLRGHVEILKRRWALRRRDIYIAQNLHLGWRRLAEQHQLDKTSVYLAARRGREYLRVKHAPTRVRTKTRAAAPSRDDDPGAAAAGD